MSDYQKLNKDDFPYHGKGRTLDRVPMLHVKYGGLFEFNRSAVALLGSRVSLCEEKSSRNCFAVMRDVDGYELRDIGVCGRAEFNNASLAKHFIDKTWERDVHAVGVKTPQSMTFLIAVLPVDDLENKDVFALIRKK